MGDIGRRIKIARKHKGLTQEGLARKIGVPQQNVARWEKGERIPGAKNLIKISRILNVSIDWLLKGESSFIVKDTGKPLPDDMEKIYSVIIKNPDIKELFVFLADISVKFKKDIERMVKAGLGYNEAILFITLKNVKKNKK